MIDEEGFRANVGIVLINKRKQLFWAQRSGTDGWQFPQGGIHKGESTEHAVYRELHEEVGLKREHVEILFSTDEWLRYFLPKQMIRHGTSPLCIGQKQIWYLLKLVADDCAINLNVSKTPEFNSWKWVDYWFPLEEVIFFKHNVYNQVLAQFALFLGIEQGKGDHVGQSPP